MVSVSAWGAPVPQLCVSCHPPHYAERGGCSGCHHGNPASGRKNIAHAGLRAGKYIRFTVADGAYLKDGQRLLNLYACRRCHVSGGHGNRLAANLDNAAARKTVGELVHSIRRPVANMPDFGLDDEQVTMVANVILAGSRGHETAGAAPVRVHFNTSGTKNVDIFSTKCGSCHRLLSERLGALGTGDVAANLSGLFSRYYPKTFGDGGMWTPRKLDAWVKNPRRIRPLARMMPLELTEAETRELLPIIAVSPEPHR